MVLKFQLAVLLAAILLLSTSCESMKRQGRRSASEAEPPVASNTKKPSIGEFPGLARLQQMFSGVSANGEDAERCDGEATVVGVYPVRAPEPCHLIELRVVGVTASFDIGAITQPRAGVHRALWQVPWQEVLLDAEGKTILARSSEISRHPELLKGDIRLAFFLHFVDLQEPLQTPFGNVDLTVPSKRPRRLQSLRYETPD